MIDTKIEKYDKVEVFIIFDDDEDLVDFDEEIAHVIEINEEAEYPYTIEFKDEKLQKENVWLWRADQLKRIGGVRDEIKSR